MTTKNRNILFATRALIAHDFRSAEPPQFNAQILSFLKNTAIGGGFLLLANVAGNQNES